MNVASCSVLALIAASLFVFMAAALWAVTFGVVFDFYKAIANFKLPSINILVPLVPAMAVCFFVYLDITGHVEITKTTAVTVHQCSRYNTVASYCGICKGE
jgi:hypothetical protein